MLATHGERIPSAGRADSQAAPAAWAGSVPARLTLLDPLRILASLAVLHVHVRGEAFLDLAFGLFLFFAILYGLGASGTRSEALGAFARRKGLNLLVPWLRWSAFYLAFFLLKDVLRGDDPRERLRPVLLFTGGDPVLWFLPWAAVMVVVAKALQRRAARLTPAVAVVLFSLLGALGVQVISEYLASGGPGFPFRAWIRSLPALAWGLALAQTRRPEAEGRRSELLFVVAGSALLPAVLTGGGPELVPLRYAVAIGLASLGFGWRPPMPAVVRTLASCTYGVYLVHLAVGIVLDRLLVLSAWPALTDVAVVWLASAGVVLAMRRLGLRWAECRLQPGATPAKPEGRKDSRTLRPAA